VPSWQGCASDLYIEFAAGPGNDSLILELELESTKGNFQSSGTFVIIDEQIRHAQCK
jgi:hypothetical protein